MSSDLTHELSVAKIIRETADACSVVFEIPSDLESRFSYVAGQFLTLQVPYEGKVLSRSYSLSSSPDCDSEHKVTIKRVDDGRISNWINDNLKEGDTVKVLPPGGRFVLNDGSNAVVLFGGGSGITPVISILKTALTTTDRSVKLVYANRDKDSIIFKDELDAWLVKYPGRLEIVHSLDAEDGFLTKEKVLDLVKGLDSAEYYICGPGAFMDTVESGLLGAGIPEERVHIERFVSPPDPEDEASTDAAAAPAAAAAGAPATITIRLDGTEHEVACEPGQSVLVASQKAGLEPPFSCTDGFCGCCMARLTAGEVEMATNDFLSKKELEQGWVLTCQAVPTSGPVKIEYPD